MYYLYKTAFGLAERGFSLTFHSFKDIFLYSLSSLQLLQEFVKTGQRFYDNNFDTLLELRIANFSDGTYKIFPIANYRAMIDRIDKHCPYCRHEYASRQSFQMDHVMPKFRGGSDDVANTLLVCSECNDSKGSHDLFYWFFEVRNQFPPLNICNYYLMLIHHYCELNKLWSIPFSELVQKWCDRHLPFAPHYLPLTYPQPNEFLNNDYSVTLLSY